MGVRNKDRFEVFKRDKFTCQYCGRAAPDVLLHLDHIKPVCEGGEDDILNLITSCANCNLGKGPRELSDETALAKQKAQLDQLQERREQLEMMMEWQRGLMDLESETVAHLSELWEEIVPGFSTNESGRQSLSSWLSDYGTSELIEAMRICAKQYLVIGEGGTATWESAEKAWEYVPKVARGRRLEREKPYLVDLRRIYNAVIVREFPDTPYWEAINEMECAVLAGVSMPEIEKLARSAHSFWGFTTGLEELQG